jgi:hypothetical protein
MVVMVTKSDINRLIQYRLESMGIRSCYTVDIGIVFDYGVRCYVVMISDISFSCPKDEFIMNIHGRERFIRGLELPVEWHATDDEAQFWRLSVPATGNH